MPFPQSGRYVCLRTPGIAAWIIRRATRSPVNHVVVLTDDDGGLAEARPEGVVRGNLAVYAGFPAWANTAEIMTGAQRGQVAAMALSLVGDWYNFPGVLDLGLEEFGWHWRWLIRLSRARHMLFCSQLTAISGAAGGLDWTCGKGDPSQVTPGDLLRRPGVKPAAIGQREARM